MFQSNWELVVDFFFYKFFQKGYSWSQFSDVEENRIEVLEEIEVEREIFSVINGNLFWYLVDSLVVNGVIGYSSSLDVWEVIFMVVVK